MRTVQWQFWFNFIGFQLGWVALVQYGDIAVPWVLIWLVIHLAVFSERKSDIQLFVVFTILGGCLEFTHLLLDMLILPEHVSAVPPIWIVMLWPLFATLLNHSLCWLVMKPRLGSILAAIGAGTSYYFGARLAGGSITLHGLVFIAFEWAVLFYSCAVWIIPLSKSVETAEPKITK